LVFPPHPANDPKATNQARPRKRMLGDYPPFPRPGKSVKGDSR
jgi:hypothetical protein